MKRMTLEIDATKARDSPSISSRDHQHLPFLRSPIRHPSNTRNIWYVLQFEDINSSQRVNIVGLSIHLNGRHTKDGRSDGVVG